MTTDKTPETFVPSNGAMICCYEGTGDYVTIAAYTELSRENAELRNDIRVMVEKAAVKSLDGYRELGQRAAHAESERDTLRAQVAALQRAVKNAHEFLSHSGNQRAILSGAFITPSARFDWFNRVKRQVAEAYTGQPLAQTDGELK